MRISHRLRLLAAIVAATTALLSAQAIPASREILLEGTLTAADRLAWLERTFEVPPGASQIDVETSYTGRDAGTTLEFGLYDPVRFRGASRFTKRSFFVGRTTATPSYHPGDLQPGTWRLLIGVPAIREGVTSRYRVVVRVTMDGPGQPAPLEVPAAIAHAGPRWYQGDLHTHTMHSDGFGCADGRGDEGPCATYMVADAAARRGLDFVAVTDHNTTSHHAEMVSLQARHERLLLLRGQEMTSFYGHANVFGTNEMMDFRIGHPGVTANDIFTHARRVGALVSINHPGRDTGEKCTGCGWNAPNTDYSLVTAMEVVNGRTVSGPTAGEPFWHARLNEGHRLTGIGGSDDHGASTRAGSAVGTPTTVIYAATLTEAGLLAGIRAGRVYIKTRGPEGPDIRFTVPELKAVMGDVLTVGSARIGFQLAVERGQGQRVEVIRNGQMVPGVVPEALASHDATVSFVMPVVVGDWVRVNLRDESGLTVLSNPIYFR